MENKYFETAGFCFSVSSEIELNFGAAEKFFYSQSEKSEIHYHITSKPDKNERGNLIAENNIFSVFESEEKIMRRYKNKCGDFVLSGDKATPMEFVLSGNADELKKQESLLIPGYLALEVPLIHCGAYVLHSSLVKTNDCAIAFSGVSGAGKSTQAELWKKYAEAEIISGDRSCLRVCDNDVSAHGTFYTGSSSIHKNDGAPLQAIVFIEHAEKNKLKRLSPSEAFTAIYSQALNNPWDNEYVGLLISHIEKTVKSVPVYLLSGRAEKEAVNLLYNELFK